MKSEFLEKGFTLIELLVAMTVVSIIMAGAIAAFWQMQSTSKTIDQRAGMAVNARSAMSIIGESIRMIGFNPEGDMEHEDIIDVSEGCCAGRGFLKFIRDDIEDPANDSEDKIVWIGLLKPSVDPDSVPAGTKWDDLIDKDGIAEDDPAWLVVIEDENETINAGAEDDIESCYVADNIAAISFAYGFDDNGDGSVDIYSDSYPYIIWAQDSDNDGRLDTELDNYHGGEEGEINENDSEGGVSMSPKVDTSKIRAVKVWLLARSKHQVTEGSAKQSFVVGEKRITPDDKYAYTCFTTTVRCRNMLNKQY